MNDKLAIVKDKFTTFKNGSKTFFKKTARFMKCSFVYLANMRQYAVPFLLVILVLFSMLFISENRRHELELKNKEAEAVVISEYFVAEELKTIGELNTAEYTYTIERSISEPRKLFGLAVPLTEKSLSVIYSGEVEVVYNTSDIKITTVGSVIFLKIPEPKVENSLTKEVVRDEDNNIFNPINSDDYAKLRDGVLDEGLNKAEAKGIYNIAESELKSIIKTHFDQFGYNVKFV